MLKDASGKLFRDDAKVTSKEIVANSKVARICCTFIAPMGQVCKDSWNLCGVTLCTVAPNQLPALLAELAQCVSKTAECECLIRLALAVSAS